MPVRVGALLCLTGAYFLKNKYLSMKKRLLSLSLLYSLLALLLLLPLLSLQAQVLQKTKITASFQQELVSQRLKRIQEKTGLTVAFEEKDVQQKTAQAASFENASLQQVLQQSLKNASLLYKELNGAIVVYVQDASLKQELRHGTVTGLVIDEENGLPVNGATVAIGRQQVISDISGRFLCQLPQGLYTAVVTNVGYNGKNITDIEVKQDAIATVNLTMKRIAGNLQGVVVTSSARRESVAALYVRQKNNAAISDGISAEQIARTPDKNIGESLKRISGISSVDNRYVVVRGLNERYNGAVLNGQLMPSTELNRKQFSFDLIPASLVENVVVTKTLTPDKSAEFGGGLVEVTTLDIPTHNFITVSAGTGYNDKTTGKKFISLPLDGKEYIGGIAKSRYLLGSLDWKDANDAIAAFDAKGKDVALQANNWGLTAMKAQPSQNYQFSLGRVVKMKNNTQWGILAGGSYRNTLQTVDVNTGRDGWGSATGDPLLNAKGRGYGLTTNLSGMLGLGYRQKNTRISLQSLYLQTYDQQLTVLDSGRHQYGNWGYYDIATQTKLWQTQLKLEQSVGSKGVLLNLLGSYTTLNKLRPDNHQITGTALLDADAPYNVNITSAGSSGIASGALRWWTRALETNFNWDASVSVPFTLQQHRQLFKGGYAGWNKNRLFFVLNSGSGFNGNGYYIPLTRAFTPEYQNTFDFDRKFLDVYRANVPLHALYGLFDNRFANRWRLVWGARAEYYNLGSVNQAIEAMEEVSKQDYTELRNREGNWHLFPSANLTYSVNKQMNLRLAYAKSIIRPDLRELSYFKEYDFELGGSYQGGPVRSTIIQHFDFRYEWYPAPGDVLSASAFYKKLNYPMSIYIQQGSGIFSLYNDKVAENYGIEFEARKSFAFTDLPVLKQITLYGNFTYMDAKVKQMELTYDNSNSQRPVPVEKVYDWEKRPQTGASNFMYNAGLYYDTKPVAVSVVYNAITNRLFRPSVHGSQNSSLYEQPMKTLDAQLAVRLLQQKLEVKLNMANLLNSYAVVYANSGFTDPDLANSVKPLSKREAMYQADKDEINYKTVPGRTYSITLTYTIK